MADQLACANCDARPTADEAKWTAKVGGTHMKRLQHGFGAAGRKSETKLRSCGPWVLADSTKEQKLAAVREWQEARANG